MPHPRSGYRAVWAVSLAGGAPDVEFAHTSSADEQRQRLIVAPPTGDDLEPTGGQCPVSREPGATLQRRAVTATGQNPIDVPDRGQLWNGGDWIAQGIERAMKGDPDWWKSVDRLQQVREDDLAGPCEPHDDPVHAGVDECRRRPAERRPLAGSQFIAVVLANHHTQRQRRGGDDGVNDSREGSQAALIDGTDDLEPIGAAIRGCTSVFGRLNDNFKHGRRHKASTLSSTSAARIRDGPTTAEPPPPTKLRTSSQLRSDS